MVLDLDRLEMEQLSAAILPIYTFGSFSEYHATENDYGTSKRARRVKSSFIIVYDLYNNKLLARTFYLEEGYQNKQRYHYCFEVNRQLAGNKYKLYCRMYSSYAQCGMRIWTGHDEKGWMIAKYDKYNCNGIYKTWTFEWVTEIHMYNNPFLYLSNSKHKYCGITEDYPNYDNNQMFDYLYKYNKHPQLEMLMKMKLEHLMKDLRGFKWNKKGVAMLGLEKWEIPYIKHMSLSQYKLIRDYVKKWKLNVSQSFIALDLVKNNLNISRRLIRYFEEEDVTSYNYRDYLHYLDLLNIPKENKYLYPKGFHQAHQEQIEKHKELENAELNKRIKDVADKYKKLEMHDNKFSICVAQSHKALVDEGKALHHCVGGYGKRMAEGNCVILFIRDNEKLNQSLYTLEYSPKYQNVVQVRGMKNSVPNEDAISFVLDWANKKKVECTIWEKKTI